MAKVDKSQVTDWSNGQTVKEDGLEKDIEILRVAINATDDEIKANKGTQDGIASRVTVAESDIDALEGRASSAETRMSNIESKNSEQDGRLVSIESETTGIGARMNAAEEGLVNLGSAKTDRTGDHAGTWHGLTPTSALSVDVATQDQVYSWIATEGQTTFAIPPSSVRFPIRKESVQVTAGGITQTNFSVPNDLQLILASGVPEGVEVIARWAGLYSPPNAGTDITTLDNYQTEVADKIGISLEKIKKREVKNKLFQKSVYKQLPMLFPDYQTIITQEAVDFIYPQSFTIDWDAREIFVLYSPDWGVSGAKRWIAVYNLDTSAYKGCFHAGNEAGEAIVVKKEGTDRYLYVKTTGHNLGKFLLNTLPTNLSSLTPVSEHNVGLFSNFSYRNGIWLVEQYGAPLASKIRRSNFLLFDDSFQRIGSINIDVGQGGTWEGSYTDYIPKRQGIALGDGFIVQSTGGIHDEGATVIPYAYQGIKVFDMKGKLSSEGLVNPASMITLLEQYSYPTNRVESEGVHVSPEGEIYSLLIHQTRLMPESSTTGLIIFKECSSDDDAIDFSKIGAVYQGFDPIELETGVYPRSGDGNMYDKLKGTILDTLDKILDFMIGTDLKAFRFYTTSVPVKDTSGVDIPTSTLVSIRNANNGTFFVDYEGNPICKKYVIYGTSGSRSQIQIYSQDDTGWTTLTPASGVTASATRPPRIRKIGKVVYLEGVFNPATPTDGVNLTTIPTNLLPEKDMWIPIYSQGAYVGRLDIIASTGAVNVGDYNSGNTSSTYISLDGVNYVGR